MPMLTIENATLRLSVLPDPGASIVAFNGNWGDTWVPLMRPTSPEILAAPISGMLASFNLVPWSNRLVGAAFDFNGAHYALRANTPQGYAIHGDVRERPWRVTEHTTSTLALSLDSREYSDFNFPFPIQASIRYALEGNTFNTTMTVINAGHDSIPIGFGFHPYFNRGFGASAQDEVQLRLRVVGVYPPLSGMTSKPIPPSRANLPSDDNSGMLDVPPEMDFTTLARVGTRDIDHCFGGWGGKATLAYPSSGVELTFSCDPVFGHVIVYTPPGKPFFAVEPVTHANDGFNLLARGLTGSGINVLQPSEALSGTFSITVVR